MFFASDNSSGAAPEIMAAVLASNDGFAPSYGNDPIMDRVRAQIREIFEAPEAAVYLVATGTAANALSLAVLTDPWGSIYCHRHAHIEVDECGAPEFYTGGAKLVLVDGAHAKMTPDGLHAAVAATNQGYVHSVQRGAVSLTNATESGAVYRADEVRALCDVAKGFGLPVHMDGARFANALVAAGCTAAEMTWKAGVDVLSFGGTKNGCMGVEAVVIFDPQRAWEFELRRKRAGHLFSKHRFLSAQFDAYLTDGLWLRLAQHANDRARHLSQSILSLPGGSLLHPAEANMIFASWPREGHVRAHSAGAKYHFLSGATSLDGPGDEALAARLVCSWSTTTADIAEFLAAVRG